MDIVSSDGAGPLAALGWRSKPIRAHPKPAIQRWTREGVSYQYFRQGGTVLHRDNGRAKLSFERKVRKTTVKSHISIQLLPSTQPVP